MADVTTSSTAIDPWLKSVLTGSLYRAQGVADMPFQPYAGQGYAPLSFNQQQAQEQARKLNGAGAPALDMAVNGAGGVLGYNPMMVTANTAANPNAAAGMADWMNPYTSSVIDASLGDLSHARDMQGVKDNASATAAHAFGGTRQAVQNSLTSDDYLRNVASTTAGLRSAGFNTAAGLAQQDASRGLQANEFNAGAMNDAAARNQQADLSGASLRNSAAGVLGSLGNSQFNNGLSYVNALANTGSTAQQTQQGQNQFDYQEFLRQIDQPYKGQTLINQSAGLLPNSSTTTMTQPSQSPLPGILGTAVSLLGATQKNGGSILGNWLG
jgi:hypothetical protein